LSWRANPDEETTDWRAVRGRTAHTVRREGRAEWSFPTPILTFRLTRVVDNPQRFQPAEAAGVVSILQ